MPSNPADVIIHSRKLQVYGRGTRGLSYSGRLILPETVVYGLGYGPEGGPTDLKLNSQADGQLYASLRPTPDGLKRNGDRVIGAGGRITMPPKFYIARPNRGDNMHVRLARCPLLGQVLIVSPLDDMLHRARLVAQDPEFNDKHGLIDEEGLDMIEKSIENAHATADESARGISPEFLAAMFIDAFV